MRFYYKVTHKHKLDNHFEKKHIGIYSTILLAQEAIKSLEDKSGFSSTIDGFRIKRVFRMFKPRLLDKTYWVDGFVTYTYTK